jgi:hypothetical protein
MNWQKRSKRMKIIYFPPAMSRNKLARKTKEEKEKNFSAEIKRGISCHNITLRYYRLKNYMTFCADGS